MTKPDLDKIKDEYAQDMGSNNWFDLVSDQDPTFLDGHIEQVANRYAMAMQRHADTERAIATPLDTVLLTAAAQGIISATYQNRPKDASRAMDLLFYGSIAAESVKLARALQKQKEVHHG